MLLDWSAVIILGDLVDSLLRSVEQGGFSLSVLLLLAIGGLVVYFAWISTNITDLPSPPRPPYVIQIQANLRGSNVVSGTLSRHSISDVRLLSSGPLVESVLSRVTPRLHTQSQPRAQPHGQQSNLFFGLLRRPSSRSLLNFRRPIRARLPTSNVIVYQQVSVYQTNISSAQIELNSETGTSANDGTTSSNIQNSSSLPGSENRPADSVNEVVPEVIHSEIRNSEGTVDSQETADVSTYHGGVHDNSSNIVQVDIGEINVPDRQVGVDVHLNGDVTILEQNLSQNSIRRTEDLNVNTSVVEATMNRCDSTERKGNVASTATPDQSQQVSGSSDSPHDSDVRITLKFLNDTQMDVTTQLSEKIADFKRRHFAAELSQNKVVRLIFNGRVLDNDGKTLQESGIFDQCVVHCLIVSPQNARSRDSNRAEGRDGSNASHAARGRSLRDGPEPGMFFVSVLGIVLIFLWFICFHFGQQLFTQSAVVSLVVLTAVFVIGLVALYLPVQSNA